MGHKTEHESKAVELLDLLKRNLPDKTGEKGKWNFEKAHSILHKVREIILWGNSDNTTCQGPDVCSDISINIQLYIAMYLYIPSIYKYVHVYTKYIQTYTQYIPLYTSYN